MTDIVRRESNERLSRIVIHGDTVAPTRSVGSRTTSGRPRQYLSLGQQPLELRHA